MRINTNIMALNAQNMLVGNQDAVQKSINKYQLLKKYLLSYLNIQSQNNFQNHLYI